MAKYEEDLEDELEEDEEDSGIFEMELRQGESIFEHETPPTWETTIATAILDGLDTLRIMVNDLEATPKGDIEKRAFLRGIIQGTLEALDYMAEELEDYGKRDTEYAEECIKDLEGVKGVILKFLLRA